MTPGFPLGPWAVGNDNQLPREDDPLGFASLVPELLVHDIEVSLAFYRAIGFEIFYDRPEEGFAFLKREAAMLMLDQGDSAWYSAPPGENPRGRGINLQIEVSDIGAIATALTALDVEPIRSVNERIYRTIRGDDRYLEMMVADPDGYRLRFQQYMG